MQLNQTKRFNNRMGDGLFMFWGLVSVVIFALLVGFGLVLGLSSFLFFWGGWLLLLFVSFCCFVVVCLCVCFVVLFWVLSL